MWLHGVLDIPNFFHSFLIYQPPSGSRLPRVNNNNDDIIIIIKFSLLKPKLHGKLQI